MEPEYKLDKNLRVGLFGISRSGKDYTIEDFIEIAKEHGYQFIHISPMNIIRERLNGRLLRDMPENEKKELVKEVREYIDEMAHKYNIIVDEHYCYPSTFHGEKLNDGYYDEKLPHDILKLPGKSTDYEVVFPRFESMKYDLIVHMDIDPAIILERMRTSEGCKKNLTATLEDIKEWAEVEKNCALNDGMGHCHRMLVRDPKKSGEELWQHVMMVIYSRYIDSHPEEW